MLILRNNKLILEKNCNIHQSSPIAKRNLYIIWILYNYYYTEVIHQSPTGLSEQMNLNISKNFKIDYSINYQNLIFNIEKFGNNIENLVELKNLIENITNIYVNSEILITFYHKKNIIYKIEPKLFYDLKSSIEWLIFLDSNNINYKIIDINITLTFNNLDESLIRLWVLDNIIETVDYLSVNSSDIKLYITD